MREDRNAKDIKYAGGNFSVREGWKRRRTWGALGDLRSCGLIIILRHGAPLLAESDSWFSHYS